ncbi:hypothetical protein KP509_32G060600 [Ceratopteris richardii]|uniref:S-acyltransferase n=1 Tax=Ceratopteris richardii TaxID=49495 RepID=A0A8T2QVB4_CERRI|nr:hypothetical protein KP509_32G060600 [Ceratopteris richardii]
MGRRSCASAPVILVGILVGTIYYTVVFVVIEEWLGLSSASGLLNAIFFSCLTVMAIISYMLAIFRDPGRIPHSYMPDMEDESTPVHEVKRKSGDLRYCQKCESYKPPRAHHCRVCKRCVLRMDHHCIWINNCVGHNNYKAFFLFVFYVVTACSYALILIAGYTIEFLRDDEERTHSSVNQQTGTSVSAPVVLKVVCAVILVPLSVALIVLLGWHVYLLLNNQTTIEVLGPNLLTWPCPTAISHIGSGLKFRTSHDGTEHDDSSE